MLCAQCVGLIGEGIAKRSFRDRLMFVHSTDRDQFVDLRVAAVNNLYYSLTVVVSVVHCRPLMLLSNRIALS